MSRWILPFLAILLLAMPVRSEIPGTLSIQGVLTDTAGTPLPDGTYPATFLFYTAPEGGMQLWEEAYDIQQIDGVFNVILGVEDQLDPAWFGQEVYVQIDLSGEPPMEPRIRLTASPYALRAAIADSVVGGGGSDDDWLIYYGDIFRTSGRVYVGVDPEQAKSDDARGMKSRDMSSSKLIVFGSNDGFFSLMEENNNTDDGRSAVFGERRRITSNAGSGLGVNETNTAVTGHNVWGDSYTFGVAGYTWDDFPHTAGVLGAMTHYPEGVISAWGALGYQDESSATWGIFSPDNVKIGGVAVLGGLYIGTGASPGYVLTSDATGNATWQEPAGGADSDWVIFGDDLYHAPDGTVAIGSNSPAPVFSGNTTLQLEADYWPGIALDKRNGSFHRWAIYQEGLTRQLQFATAATPGGAPDPKFALTEDGRMVIGGVVPYGNLHVEGGNGDVHSSSGDIHVGNINYSFRLGVHTSGGQAGEVNLRSYTNDDSGILDLGVDDHDVIRIHDYETEYPNAAGNTMVNISAQDEYTGGGEIRLYSTVHSLPTIQMDAQPTVSGGGAVIDMNQTSGISGIYLKAQDNVHGGGEITLYNGGGTSSLKLDADYSGVGESRVITDALEITGGSDLSEQFDLGEMDTAAIPGMVVCIDPNRPGRLTLSQSAYDHRVAGIISGAGGVKTGMLMGQEGSLADGELPVALAGRVYVWADADEGAIEPGDLLTTSSTAGHAMRVGDRSRAGGAILGKAMTGLVEGRGLVLALVSLQ